MFGIFLAVLALFAGAIYLLRKRIIRPDAGGLSDEMVRHIEYSGRLEFDEPLDISQIHEEEVRFWEDEPWDEPEEM